MKDLMTFQSQYKTPYNTTTNHCLGNHGFLHVWSNAVQLVKHTDIHHALDGLKFIRERVKLHRLHDSKYPCWIWKVSFQLRHVI